MSFEPTRKVGDEPTHKVQLKASPKTGSEAGPDDHQAIELNLYCMRHYHLIHSTVGFERQCGLAILADCERRT